jgi:hypothetical protein
MRATRKLGVAFSTVAIPDMAARLEGATELRRGIEKNAPPRLALSRFRGYRLAWPKLLSGTSSN